MNMNPKIAELRHALAQYGLPDSRPPVRLGHAGADSVLNGGLRLGAMHEVFAAGWGGSGFAVMLALLAAGPKPLFWVRPDYEAMEYGAVSPNGVGELGGDPRNLILVRVPNAAEALSAAADILPCPHVGALLLELEGAPKPLDLVAGRRLAFAAAASGVTVIVLREGAVPQASAALTRWQVASLASPADDDDWGAPRFVAELVRHRAGGLGKFLLQWDCNDGLFIEAAADTGTVAAAPADRPAEPQRRAL